MSSGIDCRSLGGSHFAVDVGNNTFYFNHDSRNGLLRMRQAYTNYETLFPAPSMTEISAAHEAAQRALSNSLLKR